MSVVINITSGTSFARAPVMDLFLDEEEIKTLYNKWESDWPTDSYSGGTVGITCTHVLEVGFSKLRVLFGPKFAKKLVDLAEKNKLE